MYLKRLQLQGFKSFASRTTLEFGTGITAIVGPNGSGKSNLAEALCWVLGEHGSRVLRMRRVEDAVFAGSKQRAPTGLAEVSLTFDNEAGWLPVEFSEVVITRRVYRSGEGEYQLNRSTVRLRDIHDMLRSGAGLNSYAIIGQGMVEALLNLRPEERRLLIEEAADIQRQRYRLQEAEVRLADTAANLEKLMPVLNEIERRLAQLERQAKRAATYQRTEQSLKLALRRWYGLQWTFLQRSLANAEAALAERSSAHGVAVEKQRHASAAAQGAEADVARCRAECQREDERLKVLVEGAHRLERQVSLDRQRQAMLAEQRRGLETDVARLVGELQQNEKAVALSEQRLRRLEADLTERRQRLAELESLLAAGEGALNDLRARSKVTATAARDASTKLDAVERRLREVQQVSDRARRALSEHQKERVKQTRVLVELASRLRALKDQQASAAAQMEAAAEARRSLEALVAERRLELAELESRRKILKDEVRHLSERLTVLRESQENGRIPALTCDVIGVLAQLLDVPAGLETAIAAALADRRQALVVRRREEALAGLNHLGECRQVGRLHILPLDSIRNGAKLNGSLRLPGVIGVAATLVDCEPRLRSLVDALLGHTVIVEDVDAARRVLRQDSNADAVTRSGLVLHSWGAISYSDQSGGGDWQVRREMAAITVRLEQTTVEVDAVEREIAQRRQGLQSLESELAAARDLALSTERLMRRHDEELLRLRTQLADAKGRLRLMVSAGKREQAELAAAADRLPALELERQRLREAVEQARQDASAAARELTTVEERLLPLRQAVEETRRSIAALEGELRSAHREQETYRALSARQQQELAARREQLSRMTAESEEVGARLAVAEGELTEQRRLLEAATAERDRMRESLAAAEADLARLRQELDVAQRASLEAQAEMMKAQAAAERAREAVEALYRAMRNDEVELDAEAAGPLLNTVEKAEIDAQEQEVERLRAKLRSIGSVDAQAQADYEELKGRYEFLTAQVADLQQAEAHLREGIQRLRQTAEERFLATLREVRQQFAYYFQTFFGGGEASLSLVPGSRGGEAGVDLSVRLPGKRVQGLSLLSAGEKSLTTLALLFALLHVQPSPYCVLDEVDSALDEANATRFAQGLRSLTDATQFIVITHNRRTMEAADTIYGVTMGEDGTSRVLSLRLVDLPLA